MSVGLEDVMVKPKGRPRKSVRDDTTAKLDRAILAKAKLVAADRGISVAELLSELVRIPLDKAYAVMLRKLEKGN